MKNYQQQVLEVVQKAVEQAGNQSKLATAMGTDRAKICKWLAGTSPNTKDFAVLAEYVGAQIVLPGEKLAEYELIPKTTARAGAGSSFLTEDEPDGLYAFRKDFLSNLRISKNAVLLDVLGDSMEPTLRHGDTILVDKSDIEVHDGQIYLIGFQQQLLIKRIFRDIAGLVLRSDNASYRETLIPPEYMDDFVVFGRMRWMARTF